jgi:hypothetical protein
MGARSNRHSVCNPGAADGPADACRGLEAPVQLPSGRVVPRARPRGGFACPVALAPLEQSAQQTSQAGHDSLEQSEDTGQQTAHGTTETPQQAHRA